MDKKNNRVPPTLRSAVLGTSERAKEIKGRMPKQQQATGNRRSSRNPFFLLSNIFEFRSVTSRHIHATCKSHLPIRHGQGTPKPQEREEKKVNIFFTSDGIGEKIKVNIEHTSTQPEGDLVEFEEEEDDEAVLRFLSSESEKREDRLGQEGKAHDVFLPDVMEKELLRGAISSRESLGDGGGGGGREEGEPDGEESVLLKLNPYHILLEQQDVKSLGEVYIKPGGGTVERRLFRIIQGTNEAIETINPDGRDGGIDI
ncbi:hypothetical protein HCBG_06267 [Histoplasma capsulatum G186AR]|uniref:Uncharacterized protein n=1 Tax=Ajellomyces capsulatus (strain G186AR / H82 / ATCC MYA-2454 / RMSCC 2432) TaxID=447093 RepID=C0NSY7_AJECG|nr:uncharacterized protein HCBG_06267 [Histoplasma capsulatum G186AR]EEH05148.1 hypothetical protein HCBG_06267 [Histoplasma capsulatum G186AR]